MIIRIDYKKELQLNRHSQFRTSSLPATIIIIMSKQSRFDKNYNLGDWSSSERRVPAVIQYVPAVELLNKIKSVVDSSVSSVSSSRGSASSQRSDYGYGHGSKRSIPPCQLCDKSNQKK